MAYKNWKLLYPERSGAPVAACSKPNELKMQRKEPGVGSRVPVYPIDAAFLGEKGAADP